METAEVEYPGGQLDSCTPAKMDAKEAMEVRVGGEATQAHRAIFLTCDQISSFFKYVIDIHTHTRLPQVLLRSVDGDPVALIVSMSTMMSEQR